MLLCTLSHLFCLYFTTVDYKDIQMKDMDLKETDFN